MRQLIALFLSVVSMQAVAAEGCGTRASVKFAPVFELSQQSFSSYRTAEPVPGDSELHVIGSYEGSGQVTLGATDKPVVLVLSSYEASRWQVALLAGAKLEKVVLVGHGPGQRVTGLPPEVSVEKLDVPAHGGKWQRDFGRTTYVPADFKAFIGEMRCGTGLTETSYQYSYGLGGSFAVPPSADYERGPLIVEAETPRVDPPLNPPAQLRRYEAQLEQMSPELRPTGELLVSLMRAGKFPIFIPVSQRGEDFSRPEDLTVVTFPAAEKTYSMVGVENECQAAATIGTTGADTIECAWGNQWYALGSGGDVVSDSWDDDVFISGTGADIFDGGWGNDVVVFNLGWGDDVIDKTCHHSSMSPEEARRIGWEHPFTNFLVFGKGIMPEAFAWQDAATLKYVPTGDIVTLTADCFTAVFAEDGDLPPRPAK
jgi:hypothetical protein